MSRKWPGLPTTALLHASSGAAIDRSVLAGYCESVSEFADAVEALTKHGRVVKSRRADQLTRWMYVRDRAADRLLKFAAQLGLTPAARCRLTVDKPSGDTDPYEAWDKATRGRTA